MTSALMRRSVAAIAGLGLFLGFSVLVATPAQSYPATMCSISVHPNPVVAGHNVTVTGRTNKSIDWTVKLGPASKLGPRAAAGTVQTWHGHGKHIRHVFRAPQVAKKVAYVVSATCEGGAPMAKNLTIAPKKGGGNGNGNDPDDDNHNGNGNGLPGTGGPSVWIGVLALGLLAEGARRVRKSRRSDEAA